MEVNQIIKGHVNELLGINKDISKERLEICYKCPIYTKHLGGICNSSLWFNPKNNDVIAHQEDGYVRGCGCRLQAKTKLKDAHCPAKKW